MYNANLTLKLSQKFKLDLFIPDYNYYCYSCLINFFRRNYNLNLKKTLMFEL